MLDLEAARAEVRHWLPTYERRWRVPACIVEEEITEYEWGWMFVCAPIDPSQVPAERDRWPRRSLVVDRVTGFVQLVSTAGPRIAIMKLLERRPEPVQSADVQQEEIGGLTRVTISTRAFTPLRELQAGASEPEESLEVFRRTKRRAWPRRHSAYVAGAQLETDVRSRVELRRRLMVTLETDHLTLRMLRESDFDACAEMCADSEVMRYIGDGQPPAHFSPFHFHRLFRSIVGEPLHACVKRLRLVRAIQHKLYGLAAR